MTRKSKPKKYWTYDRCRELALKYTNKTLFNREYPNAINASIRNGWYYDICSHMPNTRKPNNYWNYERCREESLKYDTKSNFNKGSGGAYNSALKNGWLLEITLHMKKINISV